jgi:hypothetical protein
MVAQSAASGPEEVRLAVKALHENRIVQLDLRQKGEPGARCLQARARCSLCPLSFALQQAPLCVRLPGLTPFGTADLAQVDVLAVAGALASNTSLLALDIGANPDGFGDDGCVALFNSAVKQAELAGARVPRGTEARSLAALTFLNISGCGKPPPQPPPQRQQQRPFNCLGARAHCPGGTRQATRSCTGRKNSGV